MFTSPHPLLSVPSMRIKDPEIQSKFEKTFTSRFNFMFIPVMVALVVQFVVFLILDNLFDDLNLMHRCNSMVQSIIAMTFWIISSTQWP